MRLSLPLSFALGAAALALAACGGSGSSSSNQTASASSANTTDSAPVAAAPAAPAAPALDSPENKKLVAELGPKFASADLANGETHFALCRSCHTVAKGGPNMTGPNLAGVFGRKAASVEGFAYSDSLKATAITWDADHLDSWVKDPKSVAADTKMSFMGIKDDKDRTDVIAYLKVASSGGAQ